MMQSILAMILGLLLQSCAHMQLQRYDKLCRTSGAPYDCAQAGRAEFEIGDKNRGISLMVDSCFEAEDAASCTLLKNTIPNVYANVKKEIEDKKVSDARRALERVKEEEKQLEEQKIESERLAIETKKQEEEVKRRLNNLCKEMARQKFTRSSSECMAASGKNGFQECADKFLDRHPDSEKTLEKCIWAIENPTESYCAKQVQRLGGSVWECIKVVEERAARERSFEADQALQKRQLEVEEDRNRQLIEFERRRAEQEQVESMRRAEAERRAAQEKAARDLSDSINKAFNPPKPKTTNCTSTRVFNQIQTNCVEH